MKTQQAEDTYAAILTRELNKLRQNGDLIAVRDVELAMELAMKVAAAIRKGES